MTTTMITGKTEKNSVSAIKTVCKEVIVERMIRFILAGILAITMIATTAIAVDAAAVKDYGTDGTAYSTGTVTIRTYKATTITLSQTKGTLSYRYGFFAPRTMQVYGCFSIQYKTNGGSWQRVEFSGRSKSIRLAANRTYTIKVVPDTNKLNNKYSLWGARLNLRWVSYPVWRLRAPKTLGLSSR